MQPCRAPIEIFDKFKPFFIKPLPFGFVFIFGTMVFACRESFLSFKSFPCRPLTSILCHIPCPCRSLRRRHLFFRKPNPVHAASFILSDFSANSPLHHPCKRRQYHRYRSRALRICEQAPPAKHIIPTEVCHCVRRKLRCPTQIRLAHFFVHKQFPKFVIAYVHGSTPLLCCFMVSAFVLFLPTFRHLFIS